MAGKRGVIDLIVGKLHMNEDDDDQYYDDNEDDEYYDGSGSNIEPFRRTQSTKEEDDYSEPPVEQPRPKKSPAKSSTPARSPKKLMSKSSTVAGGMEVCVIKPTSMEEAQEITETLLSNRTVVLNLEGLDVDIAQRIIDFTSGSTFAIYGKLQKISRYIFIVTPASVDISGDFQDLLSGSLSHS
ncbi:MAG: cell division protein SepF [Lachnospiraceae bacterium]|nr:cell division protein SepF [Lachnospiraceae bacterium]